MNRYLFFFIIVLFIGCDKTEDNIFTQTPDERLKATADEYREALFSAPNGWFLAVDTKKDGAYRLWMSFEENERVGMLSDMDATFSKAGETSVVPCISSWRLKALLAPSLQEFRICPFRWLSKEALRSAGLHGGVFSRSPKS